MKLSNISIWYDNFREAVNMAYSNSKMNMVFTLTINEGCDKGNLNVLSVNSNVTISKDVEIDTRNYDGKTCMIEFGVMQPIKLGKSNDVCLEIAFDDRETLSFTGRCTEILMKVDKVKEYVS